MRDGYGHGLDEGVGRFERFPRLAQDPEGTPEPGQGQPEVEVESPADGPQGFSRARAGPTSVHSRSIRMRRRNFKADTAAGYLRLGPSSRTWSLVGDGGPALFDEELMKAGTASAAGMRTLNFVVAPFHWVTVAAWPPIRTTFCPWGPNTLVVSTSISVVP